MQTEVKTDQMDMLGLAENETTLKLRLNTLIRMPMMHLLMMMPMMVSTVKSSYYLFTDT